MVMTSAMMSKSGLPSLLGSVSAANGSRTAIRSAAVALEADVRGGVVVVLAQNQIRRSAPGTTGPWQRE